MTASVAAAAPCAAAVVVEIGAQPHEVLLDLGGRYKLSPAFIALFMAGRSVSGTGGGQPEFNGYFNTLWQELDINVGL